MEGLAIPNRYLDLRKRKVFPLMLDAFATFKSDALLGCQGMFQIASFRQELMAERIREQATHVSLTALNYARHEVNSPVLEIAGIILKCKRQQPGWMLSEEVEKALNEIGNHLADMLDRTELLQNPQIEEYVRIPIAAIVELIANRVRQLGATMLRGEIDSELQLRTGGKRGRADIRYLDTIFTNLIKNAIAAAARKETECKIVLEVSSVQHESQAFIAFALNDNGDGFDEQQLKFLHETPSYSDKAPAGILRSSSHGLGVRLSLEIAKMHQTSFGVRGTIQTGNIDQSDRQKGARVTVILPAGQHSDPLAKNYAHLQAS